jgi:hypothetical protein
MSRRKDDWELLRKPASFTVDDTEYRALYHMRAGRGRLFIVEGPDGSRDVGAVADGDPTTFHFIRP